MHRRRMRRQTWKRLTSQFDDRPISIGLVAELEKNRLLAARMLDRLRFQHEVLAEIHDLVVRRRRATRTTG